MTSNRIPDDVRRFVLISIPSIPYLEAVLLFRREAPRRRTATQVSVDLYVTERAASELLEAMVAAGVLDRAGDEFHYAPRDTVMAHALDRLADAYADDLIGVTNLVHDLTQKSARRFADAFRLRKDR